MTDSEQTHITWRKSTASSAANCVEVGFAEESALVRNSRDPLGTALSFTPTDWVAFLAGARNGEFDLDRASNDTV